MAYYRKLTNRRTFAGLIVVFSVATIVYYNTSHQTSLFPPKIQYKEYAEIKEFKPKKPTCVHQKLELHDKKLTELLGKEIEVVCTKEEKNWLYVDNGTFIISSEAIKKHGHVQCAYTEIIRGNDDFTVRFGPVIKTMINGSLIASDFFNVSCVAADTSTYINIHQAISYQPRLHEEEELNLKSSSLGVNVLIIGLDSLSRLLFLRKLPAIYTVLKEELNAFVFEAYNILGDGTPQATLPMLTGKSEIELPESRKRLNNAVTMDDFPFIWKEFKKIGYITQMGEDYSDVGMFTYRHTGFKKQPTDHYARPYFIHAEHPYYYRPKPPCVGSETNIKLDLNWINDTYRMYPNKLKYMFHFFSEFTHTRGKVILNHVDVTMRDFLIKFKNEGHMNNTILAVLSDHGNRFSEVRQFIQGKLEERLPFLSISVPKWFKSKYAELYTNLEKNTKRLVTAYDIHEMLHEITDYRPGVAVDKKARGISLFREIPLERTCSDAGIESHWCACLDWKGESVNASIVNRIARESVSLFNDLNKPVAGYCEVLTLQNITSAYSLRVNDQVLKFADSKDMDGRYGDFSGNTNNPITTYQLVFLTGPVNGQFELTVQYDDEQDDIIIDPRQISRINEYGLDPKCIAHRYPHLRTYCVCKDRKQSKN